MLPPTLGPAVLNSRPVPEPRFVLTLREAAASNPETKRLFERAADAIKRIEQKRLDGMQDRLHDAMFEKNHFDFDSLKKLDDEANKTLLLAALLVNPYAAAAVFLGKEASKVLANAAVGAAQQAAKEATVFLVLGTIASACKAADYLVTRLDPASRPMHVDVKAAPSSLEASVSLSADSNSMIPGDWNATTVSIMAKGRLVQVQSMAYGRDGILVSIHPHGVFPQLKEAPPVPVGQRRKMTP